MWRDLSSQKLSQMSHESGVTSWIKLAKSCLKWHLEVTLSVGSHWPSASGLDRGRHWFHIEKWCKWITLAVNFNIALGSMEQRSAWRYSSLSQHEISNSRSVIHDGLASADGHGVCWDDTLKRSVTMRNATLHSFLYRSINSRSDRIRHRIPYHGSGIDDGPYGMIEAAA